MKCSRLILVVAGLALLLCFQQSLNGIEIENGADGKQAQWRATKGRRWFSKVPEAQALSPLWDCASRNDVAGLEAALAAGADPNERDGDLCTPLYIAIATRNQQSVDALLSAGADPNVVDNGSMTPLLWAVYRGGADIVEQLLQAGADPNKGVPHRLPLKQATVRMDDAIVELLLEAGADPNLFVDYQISPLAEAASRSLVAQIHMYVKAGVDPLQLDPAGRFTPLMWASWTPSDNDATGGIRALLKLGADPNRPNTFNGRTALHYAVDNGAIANVKLLLAAGADPELRDKAGRTALDILSEDRPPVLNDRDEAVRALLVAAGLRASADDDATGVHGFHEP